MLAFARSASTANRLCAGRGTMMVLLTGAAAAADSASDPIVLQEMVNDGQGRKRIAAR